MKIINLQDLTTFPTPRTLSPEELAEVYRLSKAAFTAEDLQKFTELDPGIPIEKLLAELEQQQKAYDQKK